MFAQPPTFRFIPSIAATCCLAAAHAKQPVRVFVLAGDECLLRPGSIDGAQSDAFASQYERNLTGLIRDLRRDFGKPDLPFVVAAPGQYGDQMNPNLRKVHDAPMAVGKGIPQVASINTIPFYFPKEKSPGGREWDYYNNAESMRRRCMV